MENKLYRSKTNKIVSGVCGGIGEYFGIDPTLVRLVTVILAFATFFTVIIAYLVCAFIVPEGEIGENTQTKSINFNSHKTKQILGVILIAIGCVVLFDGFIWWFDKGTLGALSIAAIGGLLLYLGIKEGKEEEFK